jgi:cell division septation protein DedD
MSDEQFHEFHLDGKQMVFLFMASTVVAVVIFLCGVMVGRGVRANKGVDTVEAANGAFSGGAALAPADETTDSRSEAASADSKSDAAAATVDAVPSGEVPAPVEDVAPSSRVDEPARAPVKAATKEQPAPPASSTSETEFREPSGRGFIVQAMTVTKHADALAEMKALKAKGYDPFLSQNGKTIRIRVGKFKTQKEAVAVRDRLKKIPRYHDAWIPPN